MNKNKNKHLFTLLEVLVSMGVFSLLMLALMQFFSAAQGVWEKSGSKSDLFDSARIAAQLLTDDLTSAFYGDEYHEMDKYRFYKYEKESSPEMHHLSFATQRSEGMTEVNYVWNAADLTLAVQEIKESDATDLIGTNNWVTYPSANWITNLRTKDANPIAENVLKFEVSNFYYDNTSTEPTDNITKNRPPAIVLVTFAVLSSAGYEKLDTLLKAVKSDASESNIKEAISGFFKKMVESTNDKFKSVDDAVKQLAEDPSDFKSVSVPAKQIIFDNVQFFKLIIPIER
ncbi:MAG: hypothetical protein IKO93_07085 [Lentisphaeria bacterium]|nr:hypothetical protein [Lentisphaeria bacterium]